MIPETIMGYAAPAVILAAAAVVYLFGRRLGMKASARRTWSLVLIGAFVVAGGLGWAGSQLGNDTPQATAASYGGTSAAVSYARLDASSGAVTFSEDNLNEQLVKASLADSDLNDSDTVHDLNFTLKVVRSNGDAATVPVEVTSQDFRSEIDSSDVSLYNLFERDSKGEPLVYVNGIQGGTIVGFTEGDVDETVTITGRLSDAAVEELEQYSTRHAQIQIGGETVTVQITSTSA